MAATKKKAVPKKAASKTVTSRISAPTGNFYPTREEVAKYLVKAALVGDGQWRTTQGTQDDLHTMTFEKFWNRYRSYTMTNQGKGKYLSMADELLRRFPPVIKEARSAQSMLAV